MSTARPMTTNLRPTALLLCAAVAAIVAARAATADVIHLRGGAKIEGSILKRNDRTIWLDVGTDVIAFQAEDVDRVEVTETPTAVDAEPGAIYHTMEGLAELSPREQARRVGPAVIKVETPSGQGSGVIIDADGHAITNAHVVQGETRIRVTVWIPQDDGTLKRVLVEDVEIVAVNNHLDLVLIRMKHPAGAAFDFAPLERVESVEVGQVVFAIGNPLGLERTLSQGVVSTKQRSFEGITYVQTDAAINPGNSGGPLFNTRGEVVGITNMGILGGEALGFAIPARYVKDFIRNREAFAYDKDNPNAGHNYHRPPPRIRFGVSPALRDGSAAPDSSGG